MAKKRVAVDDLRASVVDRQDIRLVDTYVRPQAAQQDTTMRELASFLEKASSQVAYIGRQKKDADIKVATTAAQEFAYASKEMVTFAQARESGQLDIMDDPTVELAFNKAMGIRFGRELASDLQNKLESEREAILEMDGEQFDTHFDTLSTELMNGLDKNWITQPGIRLGLLSHLSGVKNNAKQQHIAGARARKDEKLEEAFLEHMESSTGGVLSASEFATAVNLKQDEMLGAESAWTGSRINQEMTKWLSNKIKFSQSPTEIAMISESVSQIKAGSGALGGTGTWQQATQGLIREAADRVQQIKSQDYTRENRERNDFVKGLEDQMLEYYQENDTLDGFPLPETELVNQTDMARMQKQIENLLKPDADKEMTLEDAVAMHQHFAGMTMDEAMEELHAIRSRDPDSDDPGFKVTSLRQFNALQGIAMNAVRVGGNPFASDDYRYMENWISKQIDPMFNGIGGLALDAQNQSIYNQIDDDLRERWVEVISDQRALDELIPDQYAGVRGKNWSYISRKEPRLARAIQRSLIEEVKPEAGWPIGTKGQAADQVRGTITLGNGVEVEEQVNQ